MQLPKDYRVEVDVELICRVVTFRDEDGNCIQVPDWVLGPGTRTGHSIEQQSTERGQVAENIKKHRECYGSVIPVLHVDGVLNLEAALTDVECFMKNMSAALKCNCLVLFLN